MALKHEWVYTPRARCTYMHNRDVYMYIPKQHLDAAKLASQEYAFCQQKVTRCFWMCFIWEVARMASVMTILTFSKHTHSRLL